MLKITSGTALTEYEIGQCMALLKEGGAIQYFKTAESGLCSAVRIARIYENVHHDLVAMGAIKPWRMNYFWEIEKRSGYSFPCRMLELGYIVVDKQRRGAGLGERIVRELLTEVWNLFATTSNPAMMTVFRKTGFDKVGKEWQSKKGDMLSLWVRL